MMWDDGRGHMGDWGWGWGLVGLLMMTLFWGGIILIVFYAIRGTESRGDQGTVPSSQQQDRALAILQERFARGEIDREEYEERRRTLDEPLHPT